MMSKYTYIVEEWSTDTRKYRVESDEKLTEEEVKDSVRFPSDLTVYFLESVDHSSTTYVYLLIIFLYFAWVICFWVCMAYVITMPELCVLTFIISIFSYTTFFL